MNTHLDTAKQQQQNAAAFQENTLYQEMILKDGEYFTSLFKDIKQAASHIDLEVYIYNEDDLGRKLTAELIAAANRGIKIRILVDGVGSMWWNGLRLQHQNIETRVYHPFPLNFSHWPNLHLGSFLNKLIHFISRINKRNHRKVCILDNKTIYVTSINIAQCHLTKEEGGENWRDTSVRIEGCDLSSIQYAFDRAWESAAHHRIHDPFYPVDINPIFRLNFAWRLRRRLNRNLLNRIGRARKRIWVTNAYFVPNLMILRKMVKAAQNGVDVRILLSHKSDVLGMKLVARTYYTFLLKKGVKFFEYMPTILHAKIIIIDDWICVGSSNFNYRSFIHDLEVDVNLRTEAAKRIIEQHFLEDIENSRQIHLDDLHKQPFYQKFFAKLMLFIKYYL